MSAARHWRIAAGLAMVAASPVAARADDTLLGARGVLSVVVENDSLSSGDDRNYTSGVKVSYSAPEDRMPKWVRARADLTEALTGAAPKFFSFGVGQSIFTPENIEVAPAPPDEHPYAGFLYVELGMAAEGRTKSGRPFQDQYDLTLGMVGPSALGRQTQNGVHRLLKAEDPQGWDQELNDEPVFALGMERRWRAETVLRGDDLTLAFTPLMGATVGNLRTEAKIGFGLRLGPHLIEDYGPPRVKPAQSGLSHFEPAIGGVRWNLFAGIDARAVAHNVFLDGNTFRDSARVDKKPIVADIQAGATLTAGPWRFVYTYVTRTEEFETQGALQDFGVLAVSRLW